MRPVHWLAECLDCGQKCGARNAVAWAANHSRHHSHEVAVEVGLSGRFINGKSK